MSFLSLSPYSFDTSPSTSDLPNMADVPIGAIPLLTMCSPEFQDSVNRSIVSANAVYNDFLKTEEGRGFNGQIALIGDSMGAVLVYEALCPHRYGNEILGLDSSDDRIVDNDMDASKLLTAPSPKRRSSSTRWVLAFYR